MIPDFPLFAHLDIEHRKEVEEIVAAFEPFSDFNFTSLFCWNYDGKTKVSKLHGNLVISMPDYVSGLTVYSFIGRSYIDETIATLLKLSPELKLIPSVIVNNITSSKYSLIEDVDNFDYIYTSRDIATMPGGIFKKKRNKLHKLLSEVGSELSISHLQASQPPNQKEVLSLFNEWVHQTNKTIGASEHEKVALSRLLDYYENLSTVTTEVRLQEKLIGFSINETVGDYAICHFEKCLPVCENASIFLTNQVAAKLNTEGVQFLNWAQDLGIQGLRESKLSYHPCNVLKKYRIDQS